MEGVTTEMFAQTDTKSAETPTRRSGRLVLRGFLGLAMAAASVAMMGGAASAAPGDTSADTTVANVGITSSIALSGLTSSFTLNGLPGATVTGAGDVTFKVETNNISGYAVSVQAQTPTLVAATAGNLDSIPIGSLQVRQSVVGTPGGWTSISSAGAVTVHTQAARSALGGDAIGNDYQIQIPFVAADTYSATLDYIATAL
jgi:hypothetical protein